MLFANVSQRLDNEKRFKDTEFFLFQRNQKGKKISSETNKIIFGVFIGKQN